MLIVLTQSNSIILDCTFSNFQNAWLTIGTVYQCKATIISRDDEYLSEVTNVTQNHMEGKTNDDVEFLWIIEPNLEVFPKGIEKFFPNLKGLNPADHKLKAFKKDDLKVFPKLLWISFYSNEITRLDDDLFSATPKLQYINLKYNRIKNIGVNTFKSLKNLQYLYLEGEHNCFKENAETRDEVENLVSKLPEYCLDRFEMLEKNMETELNTLKNQIATSEIKFDDFKNQVENKLNGLKNQIEYLVKKMENMYR